jgi:hypothetical protein
MTDDRRAKMLLLYGEDPCCQNCFHYTQFFKYGSDEQDKISVCLIDRDSVWVEEDDYTPCPEENVCDKWEHEKHVDKILKRIGETLLGINNWRVRQRPASLP